MRIQGHTITDIKPDDANKPGTFSPLVEDGSAPSYAMIPGVESRPHWPNDMKLYAY